MCNLIDRFISRVFKKSVSDNFVETAHTSGECVHTAVFDEKQNRTIHEEFRFVSGSHKGIIDIYDYYEYDGVSTTVFHSLLNGKLVASNTTTEIVRNGNIEYYYYRDHISGTTIQKRF